MAERCTPTTNAGWSQPLEPLALIYYWFFVYFAWLCFLEWLGAKRFFMAWRL